MAGPAADATSDQGHDAQHSARGPMNWFIDFIELVAAAFVGVATGSLKGTPASGASTGSGAGTNAGPTSGSIVYSSPAAAPAFTLPSLSYASTTVAAGAAGTGASATGSSVASGIKKTVEFLSRIRMERSARSDRPSGISKRKP